MLLNEATRHLAKGEMSGNIIQGIYRVTEVHWHQHPNLGRCRLLELHDSSGSIEALLPGDECRPWLNTGNPYSIQMMPLVRNPRLAAQVVSISEIPESSFNPIALLPACWTPCPQVLPRLLALYQELELESMARFWEAVFRNEFWVKEFMRAPASRSSHHNAPGELLAHSVTVAESVSALLAIHNSLSKAERDATVTVALLHDATKVIWSSGNRNRWAVPFLFREHERLLPYFLSDPLVELRDVDENSYNTLLRILDDYTRPRERPNSPLSSLIRCADHLDSHLDARARMRNATGNTRNWLDIGGRMHWSLL